MEKISADARLAEQEMGLSTLYLAFGFLEWFESEASDKNAFAPLLLLPVRLEVQKFKGKAVYSISAREGEAEANLSLQKWLEKDFDRTLPDLQLNEAEADISIEEYLDNAKAAVDGLKRWQVRRWLVLGHFAFGKFAMYADLAAENWDGVPMAHLLVGSILKGVDQTSDPDRLPSPPDDYPVDEPEFEKFAPYLIQDADASQHSALIDVMKSKNFVIEGPPGTGKSQTITNVIANALAVGKRVLFLAEKRAALDVVKRRLDRSELGEFCLELHSDKTSAKSFVESLKARVALGTGRLPSNGREPDPILDKSRRDIGAYLSSLHSETSDGATAFGLIWETLRGRTTYSELIREFDSIALSPQLVRGLGSINETAEELKYSPIWDSAFAASFCHPSKTPWASVSFTDFPTQDSDSLLTALEALKASAVATLRVISLEADLAITDERDLIAVAELDETLGAMVDVEVIARISMLDLPDLETALSIRSIILTNEVELAAMADICRVDPDQLAVAAAHARAPASTEYFDEIPEEAYAKATADIVKLDRLIELVEGISPALGAFGVGNELPAQNFEAIAAGAIIGGRVPQAQRRWLREFPETSEAFIETAHTSWRPLAEAEKEWSARLPSYASPRRPQPEDLDRAASVLRKRGLRRLAARLTGAMRTVRDQLCAIGFDSDPSPEDVSALAAHVGAVIAFETDRHIAAIFGQFWRGLNTPIAEILAQCDTATLRARSSCHSKAAT